MDLRPHIAMHVARWQNRLFAFLQVGLLAVRVFTKEQADKILILIIQNRSYENRIDKRESGETN